MSPEEAAAASGSGRSSHNRRIGFAALAFGLAAVLLVLIDRSGAPERLVRALALGITLAGMAVVGILGRTMLVSRFYAMGENIAPPVAGLGCAALVFGLALPLLPGLHAGVAAAVEARVLLAGCAAGLAFGALAIWPLLRATGAFSLADLLAARFSGGPVRFLTASLTALVGALIAMTGASLALQALISGAGMTAAAAAGLLALTLACVCVPGGLRGAFGGALASGGFLILALGGAVLYAIMARQGQPLATAGALAVGAATDALQTLGQAATEAAGRDTVPLALVAALGLATLAPLTQCGLACSSPGQSRRAGLGALGWGLAIFTVAAFLATLGEQNLASLFSGQAALPQWLFDPGAGGALAFCGQSAASLAAAQKACAQDPGFPGALQLSNIDAGGAWLLLSLPRFAAANPAIRGLVAATAAALGVSVAAMGLHAFATAVGHDALYRRGGLPVLTSARLAMTRLVMLGGALCLALAGVSVKPDPRVLVGLAVALSAATFAPLLLLAFWPRATGGHAAAATLAGLACFALALARAGLSPGYAQLADATLVGIAAALLTGVCLGLTSRTRPANRAAAQGLRRGTLKALQQRPGA